MGSEWVVLECALAYHLRQAPASSEHSLPTLREVTPCPIEAQPHLVLNRKGVLLPPFGPGRRKIGFDAGCV